MLTVPTLYNASLRAEFEENRVLYMFRGRLEKPADMSNEDFYAIWEQEAIAAMALIEEGSCKWVYKVAGQPEVVSLIDVPDADTLDRGILELPFWRLGAMHMVKDATWTPLRTYASWFEDLQRLAHPAKD